MASIVKIIIYKTFFINYLFEYIFLLYFSMFSTILHKNGNEKIRIIMKKNRNNKKHIFVN